MIFPELLDMFLVPATNGTDYYNRPQKAQGNSVKLRKKTPMNAIVYHKDRSPDVLELKEVEKPMLVENKNFLENSMYQKPFCSPESKPLIL